MKRGQIARHLARRALRHRQRLVISPLAQQLAAGEGRHIAQAYHLAGLDLTVGAGDRRLEAGRASRLGGQRHQAVGQGLEMRQLQNLGIIQPRRKLGTGNGKPAVAQAIPQFAAVSSQHREQGGQIIALLGLAGVELGLTFAQGLGLGLQLGMTRFGLCMGGPRLFEGRLQGVAILEQRGQPLAVTVLGGFALGAQCRQRLGFRLGHDRHRQEGGDQHSDQGGQRSHASPSPARSSGCEMGSVSSSGAR